MIRYAIRLSLYDLPYCSTPERNHLVATLINSKNWSLERRVDFGIPGLIYYMFITLLTFDCLTKEEILLNDTRAYVSNQGLL